MGILVTSWNVEKTGLSSAATKQEKVYEFMTLSAEVLKAHIIFMCEVHSAQVENYVGFCQGVFTEYATYAFPGGHSNAYVLMVRHSLAHEILHDSLQGVNRSGVIVNVKGAGLMLALAHFKSGQTGLTKHQLEELVVFLHGISGGKWAITGDMNWDYTKAPTLSQPPGTTAHTCWSDMTQRRGGILDWCLAGPSTKVKAQSGGSFFPPLMCDMNGPDHRPVAFFLG